jgi:hypothetical protein
VTPLHCGRCGSARELADNFCRQCGHQFTLNLPALRLSNLPVRGGALPQSLVGSVAVLALSTGLEWLARRMAGSAARAANRALTAVERPAERDAARQTPPPADATVDEFLYVRKIQLRR